MESRPTAPALSFFLEWRNVRNEPPVRGQLCVPAGEHDLQLARLVAPLREAHWLARLRGDAVLVPRDVPRDRDHDLRIRAGQRNDADPWLTETLRDPRDRPPERARVEELRSLDHRLLGLGEAAQDRLVDDALDRLLAGFEQRAQSPEPLAPAVSDDRGRGTAFLQPAVVDGDLDAERADVDE